MKEVERIIRVDHAGEYGAIHIYRTQLFLAKYLYKDVAPKIEEMLSHELVHYSTFNRLLKKRNIRSCYGIHLWAFGGVLLGLATGLLGRNAIWVCTASIESTVLHHLEWQMDYLSKNDTEAYEAVASIKADEEEHQNYGATNASSSYLHKPLFSIVRGTTEFAIWLSTKL